MNVNKAYILASRFYLTDELPADFDKLDEQEVMNFIEEHKWEPLEYWEPHGVWELIDDLAREFHNQNNHESLNS